MSIIQRRSNQKLEPQILPGPGGAPLTPVNPTVTLNSLIPPLAPSLITDDRHFLTCRPSSWEFYQTTQCAAFLYSLVNAACFTYFRQTSKNMPIHTELLELDLKYMVQIPFAVSAVNWFFISMVFFKTFSVLVERNICPFVFFENGTQAACVLVSFAALNNVRDTSHLTLIAFLAYASSGNILVTEHHSYYMRSMARLGIRSVQKLELLLPFSISALTLVFGFLTPHILFELNDVYSTFRHTFKSIGLYYTVLYLLTSLWLFTSSFKYGKLLFFVETILFLIRFQFAHSL